MLATAGRHFNIGPAQYITRLSVGVIPSIWKLVARSRQVRLTESELSVIADFMRSSHLLSTCGDAETSLTQRTFTDLSHAFVTGTRQAVCHRHQPRHDCSVTALQGTTCNKIYIGTESSRKSHKARYEADFKAAAVTESQQICNRRLTLSSQMVACSLHGELTRLLVSFGSSCTFCQGPGHCKTLMCRLQAHIHAFKEK